jgi:hypothetical protein
LAVLVHKLVLVTIPDVLPEIFPPRRSAIGKAEENGKNVELLNVKPGGI